MSSKTPAERIPKSTSNATSPRELSGISELVFLDRYAIKDPGKDLAVGDTVVVLVKDDARFPQREVGIVRAIDGDMISIEIKESGEIIQRERKKVDKPLETRPSQMWDRMAQAIVEVEDEPKKAALAEDFRWLLDDFRFSPGGRINAMLGTGQDLTAYNCYVIGIGVNGSDTNRDSRQAIIDTLGNMVEIMSRGGGVGINLSTLRPRLAYVKGVNGRSSGAVSWGGLFSFATGLVEQGGCFGPDQRIATTKGLIPASELAQRMEQGEIFEALTHQGPRLITARFRNGEKELFRVTTAKGLTVEVTADHKMGVLRDGEIATIPLRDLEIGDKTLLLLGSGVESDYVKLDPVHYERSVMSTRLNEDVTFPSILDERLAYLLGYMHGDGYVHIGKKVTWEAPKAVKMAVADAHPEIRETLTRLSHELFGLEAILEDRVDDGCSSVSLYSRMLVEWLDQNGLLKAKADSIRVPEAIFRSPSSVMGAFVAGYFDADDCDRTNKGGYGFDSISLEMLRDVQQLLVANGIVSHINTFDRSAEGWRTIHRLCVTGAEFKERMSAFISLAHKNKNQPGLRNHGNNYPREVWDSLDIPGRYYQGVWDSTKERISYRALDRIRERLVSDGNVALAEKVETIMNVLPDSIVAIESIGVSDVFDFEVLDVHMLSGNGLYTSNSRRGALMLILNDWHPDILDFINAKRDMGAINNANISVGISDSFMKAVEEDAEWDLVFPDTSDPEYDTLWDGNLKRWRDEYGKPVKVYQTLRAREMWDTIMESAWMSAEPGVVFLERMNDYSNAWYFEDLVATNPCVTGDTLVYTDQGLQRADDLWFSRHPVHVTTDSRMDRRHFLSASEVFATGIKQVYRLLTEEGFELRLTADHRVMTKDRGWVEAQDLEPGDKILVLDRAGGFGKDGNLDLGRTLGWLVGDGTIISDQPVLSFVGPERGEIAPLFQDAVNRIVRSATNGREYTVSVIDVKDRDESRVQSARLLEIADEHGLTDQKHQVPAAVMTGSREMQVGFLQALFSADGHVEMGDASRGAIVLTSISETLLQDVQRLLLNFGIYSRIYKDRHSGRLSASLPDGESGLKTVSPNHDLRITSASMEQFRQSIGFLVSDKQTRLEELISRYSREPYREEFVATFESLKADGEEMVYDLHVPDVHAFVGNGLVIHNCGEQPLPSWGVCNLGHINLSRFVKDKDVAWDDLARAVRLGVRFLDNIIDITPYFFEPNERVQKDERRIGMGTLGLGEMLIRLGVRYGSDESVELIDRIYQFIATEAYLAGVELAKEKGSFPKFDADKFLQSKFIQGMPQKVQEAIKQHGIRNVCLLTQAPTGSTGTMIGTSTGIEPYYSWSYWRKGRLGMKEVQEAIVQEWFDAHPEVEPNIDNLPDYFVTAMDLEPKEHIKVQAAIQRWTDSSISKTANCPNHYTVEQTKELYEYAYKLGCKGVTIYRDGSRDEQVLTRKEDDADKSQDDSSDAVAQQALTTASSASNGTGAQQVTLEVSARAATPSETQTEKWEQRPQKLTGATYEWPTPLGKAFITVNELDGKPVEVFVNIGKAGSDVAAASEALGRLVTLFLKHANEPDTEKKVAHLVDHLSNIGGSTSVGFGENRVSSVPDAIAKTLRKHLAENGSGLNVKVRVRGGHDLCPTCGVAALAREEGCYVCKACGYTKC